MRIILFFDIPMETSSEKKQYLQFLKKLKGEGFIMMQRSVYIKLSINKSNVDSTIKILKKAVPKNGDIAVLVVTEKQFASIEYLIGDFKTDIINSEDRIIEI